MKFSITIPSYKILYLEDAIKSVVAQTYTDWELIVVDDCSPEDVLSVVKKFSTTDKRIRYYRNNSNIGPEHLVNNWNNCITYCSGDYIICMGDDDCLEPNCMESYAQLISQYPGLNVYHSRTRIIDSSGDVVRELGIRPIWESGQDMMKAQWKNNREQFIGDFLFSRQWLTDSGGYVNFPFAYSSDWATANLAAMDGGIANLNLFGFRYRDNSLSISRSQNLRQTVLTCSRVKNWYLRMFQNRQLQDTELTALCGDYFDSMMVKLIQNDIKSHNNSAVSDVLFWMRRSTELNITYWAMAIICFKAVYVRLFRNPKH